MTIRHFHIEYDAINRRNTFTNGDTINGRIVLEASKETTVQSLVFIAKGKARVCWSEHYGLIGKANTGDLPADYRHKQKYYRVKSVILNKASHDGSEVIGPGRHVFPFSFKIPGRKLPSSFYSLFGQIIHTLKAELKQHMKLPLKAKTHFTFVSKAEITALLLPGIMSPQVNSREKKLAFGSGSISMTVRTRKMGYKPGESLLATVEVYNLSSRSVRPRLVLEERKIYNGGQYVKVEKQELLQEKADIIGPHSGNTTLQKVVAIPKDAPPSILVCSIIKLEYRLKVYLDVSYAAAIEVKLPVVIIPDAAIDETQLPPSYESVAQQQTWSSSPPPEELPPSYETIGLYPSLSPQDFRTAL